MLTATLSTSMLALRVAHGPWAMAEECKKIRQHFAVGLSFVLTVTWHVFTVGQLAIYGQAKQLPTATSTNDFNNWQQQSSTWHQLKYTQNMKPHSNAINVWFWPQFCSQLSDSCQLLGHVAQPLLLQSSWELLNLLRCKNSLLPASFTSNWI